MFYIEHEDTAKLVAIGCTGEHDLKTTDELAHAVHFSTYAKAHDFSQNFGPCFNVVEHSN